MLPKALNENQLKLFTKFVSITVQNNQEIHPSDMPPVVEMFKLLADRGYYVTHDQIDIICESLHSLANRALKTSEELREYLKHVASTFHFYAMQLKGVLRYKRSATSIADDIVSENDVEYSET